MRPFPDVAVIAGQQRTAALRRAYAPYSGTHAPNWHRFNQGSNPTTPCTRPQFAVKRPLRNDPTPQPSVWLGSGHSPLSHNSLLRALSPLATCQNGHGLPVCSNVRLTPEIATLASSHQAVPTDYSLTLPINVFWVYQPLMTIRIIPPCHTLWRNSTSIYQREQAHKRLFPGSIPASDFIRSQVMFTPSWVKQSRLLS